MLESRRLLDGGGVPAGMGLGQANWFYQNVFLPPANVAPAWNGNVASGDAGTLGADYLAAIVARINAYRWMAGLPGGVTLNPAESAEDQQDALMTAANDQLSHDPPSTWIDYTAAGADAAAHSDLYLGLSGTSAIDGYMIDPGDNNTIVGHRRWILDGSTQTMGVGDIPGQSDSLYVIQPQTTPVPSVSTVAWPPAGFVPAPLIPDRWSLQAPYGSDFSNATVTVTENGVTQPVEILSNSGLDYGGQAIVWDMPDTPAPQPGQQVAYAVQVDNVVIDGQSHSFSYTTTSFDPSTTTELTPVLAEVGLLQTSAQVDSTDGSITIDVACSMNVDKQVSVDYSTVDGTALSGTNYVSTSGVLTFVSGQFYSQIVIPILAGDSEHPSGTFSVTLSTPTKASVGPISSFEVTINGASSVAQPDPPVLLPADSDGSADGETTFLTSPYFIGTTEPGETVQLIDSSGTVVDATHADVYGNYEIQVPGPLSVGSYQYRVVVVDQSGEASNPSAPQTITVINTPTPLVTVESLQVEKIKDGKGKKAKKESVIVLQFSGALSAAAATNAKAYEIAPVIKVKAKGKGKRKQSATTKLGTSVTPASAEYTASNNQVTLTPRGTLMLTKPEELIVNAALVTDALGREIDGNDDGQPGGDYIATIGGSRVTAGGIPLARTQRQPASVADVVDHLLARGELTEQKANRQRNAENE